MTASQNAPLQQHLTQLYQSGLMWFRRDLRANDNAALYHALKTCRQVHCVFVFDSAILATLPREDRRVEFIRESLVGLDADLRAMVGLPAAGLIVLHAQHGKSGDILFAEEAIPQLAQSLGVQAVFANHDDEPQALTRDATVSAALEKASMGWHTFKDHVIFERDEILTQMGKPYSVFTPYKNAWLKKVNDFYLKPYPVHNYAKALSERPEQFALAVPTLSAIGFIATNLGKLKIPPGSAGARALFEDFFERMDDYETARNFPSVKGPSYLGVHLRFGTVSLRQLAATAYQMTISGSQGAAVWLSELIWRDFYVQIMYHTPHVVQRSFKPAYDAIQWESGTQADHLFAAWCEGRTGYPLVDAAMAQINQTGYMHNRLRMVVASFLVKDLGIDWRWGERYFAEKLNDFDLSANNGGWQWASSSGCDAQPYFRIFNPVSQSEKFDAEGKFIRRYLPQLAKLPNSAIHAPWEARPLELQAAGVVLGVNYPLPVVEHSVARALTLQRYAVVKSVA